MKKTILFIILNLLYLSSHSQSKEICITVDDLPVVSYDFNDIDFQQSIIQKLIHTFNEYHIPAIGFVNEHKLYVNRKLDTDKVDLLKMWLGAGYELGNHTYSHKDCHKVSYAKFTKDILDGEKVCKQFGKRIR